MEDMKNEEITPGPGEYYNPTSYSSFKKAQPKDFEESFQFQFFGST